MGHAPFGERKWRAFTKWLTTEHFLLPSPYSSRSAQQTKSLFQSRVLCFPKCRRAKSFSVKIVVPCSLVCFTWITGLTVSACGVFGVFLFPSLCFLNAACTVLKRAHFHAALARVVCECDSKPIRSTELEQSSNEAPAPSFEFAWESRGCKAACTFHLLERRLAVLDIWGQCQRFVYETRPRFCAVCVLMLLSAVRHQCINIISGRHSRLMMWAGR